MVTYNNLEYKELSSLETRPVTMYHSYMYTAAGVSFVPRPLTGFSASAE